MSLYHSDNIVHRVVDSSKRLSGTTSNFTIDLSLPSICQSFNKVCFISCSIPKSWYDIQNSIAVFTLTELGYTVNCNIIQGFYSSSTLRTAIVNVLNTNSPNSWVYNVSYSSITNKFTITTIGNDFSLGFPIESLYVQMGFGQDTVVSSLDGVLESSNSIAIPHINKLFIKSDCCNTTLDNLLMEIYITSSYQSLSFVYFENTNGIDVYSKPFSLSSNNVYNFIICDSRGQEIDFQGHELHLSLIFYKKDSTNQAVLENLKADNLEKILA